jgi:hypothetical protein
MVNAIMAWICVMESREQRDYPGREEERIRISCTITDKGMNSM